MESAASRLRRVIVRRHTEAGRRCWTELCEVCEGDPRSIRSLIDAAERGSLADWFSSGPTRRREALVACLERFEAATPAASSSATAAARRAHEVVRGAVHLGVWHRSAVPA